MGGRTGRRNLAAELHVERIGAKDPGPRHRAMRPIYISEQGARQLWIHILIQIAPPRHLMHDTASPTQFDGHGALVAET